MPFQIPPESLVSYAVDNWTNGSWQNLHYDISSKEGVCIILRKPLQQSLF